MAEENKTKKIDFNALGQAMDTSFGRSSQKKTATYADPDERTPVEWTIATKSVSSKFATNSVKASFIDENHIELKYSAIVNFGSNNERVKMVRAWEDEAKQLTSDTVKNIKLSYKDITGETISFKEIRVRDSIELISGQLYNPRQTAYYRRIAVLEIK